MEEDQANNIIIFPFMAQGHIIPFLALALHLESKLERLPNLTITFLGTPLNVAKLRSSLPPSTALRLVNLPFRPSDHGLPPDAENTDALPYPLVVRLLHASTSLRDPFRDLLLGLVSGGRKPLCVIGDIFFGWTATVCRELGIFHAVFSGASGFGLACYYSLWVNLPHRKKPESVEFSLPDFQEGSPVHVSQLPMNILEADGTDLWSLFQAANLSAWVESNGILFNTVAEFDSVGLSYFRQKLGVEVWAVGPVLLSAKSRRSTTPSRGAGAGPDQCIAWLDTKPPKSVLYVSFGSMNTITAPHMMELATALESSGRDFIWVVRPPVGHDINAEFDAGAWLPEGFERKIAGRGLLVERWAPQAEILAHGAVAAFLTHCGWNSVLEALSNGVPLLGWPMAAEQSFNARLLEGGGVGACVEVARGRRCEVRGEELREKIEMAMGDTERGREMRSRAEEAREMIQSATRDDDDDDDDAGGQRRKRGSSARALDEFIEAAMRGREESRNGKKNENGHACIPEGPIISSAPACNGWSKELLPNPKSI
ncbi:UDP-glycosyltransferase 92A1 [Rhodamnia argentea]|uniref:Glycosyltransferase n=1 Tax=Rhodamnia argentea TaxID=178133 RepID=A0A8B8NVH1_9MYRT|nr:UDP-glycosyltransferase 92A1 [Rhodamnia argentea]